MKKILTQMGMICMFIYATSFTAHAVAIDVTSTSNWLGYMNWFENDNGAQGAYVQGSEWGTTDLPASWSGEVLTLAPNTNTYANSLGGTDGDRAYWTDSPDGGVTAGSDGNKWMEASFFREADGDNTAWNGQTLTFSGSISGFTLNSRYNAVAFIKTLDANAGYATVQNEVASITSTGDFSLSLDVLSGSNYIAQIGFTMTGLNANPATDWGSVTTSSLSAEAVPEPSTFALLVGFVAFLFISIRSRK